MDEAFEKWDSLLQRVTAQQRPFLAILVDEMLLRIVQPYDPTARRPEPDVTRDTLLAWLQRIHLDESWLETREYAGVDARATVRACLASPGSWTTRLAQDIVDAPGYEETESQYRADIAEVKEAMERKAAPAPKTYQASPGALALMEAWEKGEGDELAWVPKPIGMAGLTARRHIMPPQETDDSPAAAA